MAPGPSKSAPRTLGLVWTTGDEKRTPNAAPEGDLNHYALQDDCPRTSSRPASAPRTAQSNEESSSDLRTLRGPPQDPTRILDDGARPKEGSDPSEPAFKLSSGDSGRRAPRRFGTRDDLRRPGAPFARRGSAVSECGSPSSDELEGSFVLSIAESWYFRQSPASGIC